MENEAQDQVFDEWLRTAQQELQRKERKARVTKVVNAGMYVVIIVGACITLHVINSIDGSIE